MESLVLWQVRKDAQGETATERRPKISEVQRRERFIRGEVSWEGRKTEIS